MEIKSTIIITFSYVDSWKKNTEIKEGKIYVLLLCRNIYIQCYFFFEWCGSQSQYARDAHLKLDWKLSRVQIGCQSREKHTFDMKF